MAYFAQDHFDLILSLLDEMLSAGRASLTSGPQLRELVPPLERGVAARVAQEVNTAAGSAARIVHLSIGRGADNQSD